MAERIPLQRAVAEISEDSVAIRRSRAQLVAPLIQLALAAGSVALIVAFLDALPFALLMVLLVVALLMGPIATLGLVYNVIGRSVLLEREKQSVRWQQGLLGLGLGTDELVPFWRIDHIAVEGDYEAELASGERQDLVSWEVELVKDNGKRLTIGTVVAARPLAAEGLARANRLAEAVAERSDSQARLAALPDEAPEGADLPAASRPRRRRRMVRVGSGPPEVSDD
ncbi:MAG: hypothetical protein F4Z25_01455 [Chloroflexi bacterium]|nr:hypothetical protein [Chloroflexota bacterium]